MSLNKVQKEHIRHRIWSIMCDKERELNKLKDDELKKIDEQKKSYQIKLIQDGKAKLKSKFERAYYVTDIFDFPKNWEKPFDELCEKIEANHKIQQEILSKKQEMLMDEIILGDQENALKMLREFEQFKP